MVFSHKRLLLIPLDSRPVCYDMPRRLAAAAGLALQMPSPALLGHLKTPANFSTLSRWIKNHLFENDPVIVALDTITYGGLIASRVNAEPLDTLKKRADTFFSQIKADQCFGFSSILRIPSYNGNEEEPDYWAEHGSALYAYSVDMHEHGKADAEGIPPEILEDFLKRRTKNFALNQHYLGDLTKKNLNYLTYCQDDTGAFGLNVHEADNLKAQIEKRKLGELAHLQTGADEVACVMLARWLSLQQDKPLRIFPRYTSPEGANLVARFDGVTIAKVVEKAICACGAVIADSEAEADLWLAVHTPTDRQGDHCASIAAHTTAEQSNLLFEWMVAAFDARQPLAIADVASANGADARLVEKMVSRFSDLSALYGFAAWNTPGNTIGTTVAMAIVRLIAEKNQTFNADAFNRLLLIRFADDWLYEADVRQTIRAEQKRRKPGPAMAVAQMIEPNAATSRAVTQKSTAEAAASQSLTEDTALLNVLMADGLTLLKRRFGLSHEEVTCRFPCQRTFEVEITLK